MQNRIVLAGGWAQKISVSPFRSHAGFFAFWLTIFSIGQTLSAYI